ncbi:MAG: energy-coupling factor transporter transmembrane component T family protein [Actinomycetota bacterium]
MSAPVAGDRAPLPVVLLVLAAGVLAFTTDQPLVLAALAVGAIVLLRMAPGSPGRLVVVAALVSAIGVFLLTPLVSGQGDLVLVDIPVPPPLSGEITAEELVAGAAAALRVLATIALAAALFAWADPDRMLAGLGRVAPRSALVSALAARLVPTMRRDARAIAETARLRGVGLTTGSRMQRARAAAPLALPLVGSALERGLDAAEAMAARGYGEGRRTRLPERPRDVGENVTLGMSVLLAGVVAWAIAAGAIGFTFYPVLGPVLTWQALVLSAAALLALVGSAVALSRAGSRPSGVGRPYSP